MLQGPPVQVTLQVEPLSHFTWQRLFVQRKLHSLPSVHAQVLPHSVVVVPESPLVPPDVDVPPSFVVVPLEPPLLLVVVPPELDVELLLGAPPPIVQSYEQAPRTNPAMAVTTARRTLEV